jgi:hypothetical protein
MAAAIPMWGQLVGTPVVCLDPMPNDQIGWAAEDANDLFRAIGIRLEWRFHRPCPDGVDTIHVSFSNSLTSSGKPGALAYTYPYEGHRIVILIDRVKESTGTVRRLPVSRLLAYVMAHEIGHVLEGIARHSETGIMKGVWSYDEYARMSNKTLTWAPEDAVLMRMGLAARARLAANRDPLRP